MPRKGERERKIRALRAGRNVRPPRKWFNVMFRRQSRNHPNYTVNHRRSMVGVIWRSYPRGEKIRIVREMQD